jgi:hypothetical protein
MNEPSGQDKTAAPRLEAAGMASDFAVPVDPQLTKPKRILCSSDAWVLLASALVLVFAPSTRSLWIDEALVARMAMQPTFGEWLNLLLTDFFSEFLKPLYVFASWLFAHVLGTSEWALRAPNLVWLWGALLCFWRLAKTLGIPFLPVVFVCHPFVWFYADEARPYAMQICGGSMMLLALNSLNPLSGGPSGSWRPLTLFWAGSFLSCGASMLGVLATAAVGLTLVGLYWKKTVPSGLFLLSAPWLLLHAALGGYFAWKLIVYQGQTGAMLWPVSPANVVFALYEILGFLGLGPGRSELREVARAGGWRHAALSLIPYALGCLSLAGVYAVMGFRILSLDRLSRHRWLLLSCIVICLLTIALMFIGAKVAGWPFWGRHLAPILPFLILACALAIQGSKLVSRIALSIWIALLFCSALMLRFHPSHDKDNNREAARVAKEALGRGEKVWWVADPFSANYYHLATSTSHARPPKALLLENASPDTVSSQPPPDLVVFFKPEISDSHGAVADFLRRHNFTREGKVTGFSFWRPAGSLITTKEPQ